MHGERCCAVRFKIMAENKIVDPVPELPILFPSIISCHWHEHATTSTETRVASSTFPPRRDDATMHTRPTTITTKETKEMHVEVHPRGAICDRELFLHATAS